ncbi:MAG: Rne/Rng family ribonuclease, partial [Pseudomonadota bacterium]
MAKRMFMDASHPEETRVVVFNGNRLEDFDYETVSKKQLKGNIYLAKITRVEPSLQAAFVDYGGNRHGFLPFSEIHPDYYRIPIEDREALLAEEAALKEAADHDDDHDDHDEANVKASEADGAQDAEKQDASNQDTSLEEGSSANLGEENADSSSQTVTSEDTGAEDTENGSAPALVAAATPAPSVAMEPAGSDQSEAEAAAENQAADGQTTDGQAAGDQATDDHPDEDHSDEDQGATNGSHVKEVAAEANIDTVGGDEIEEAEIRRARLLRRYKIQEVIKRRQIILVQVTKEERGNKGAALTTYLSLAGRYCVLMPNTNKGGGISRKIGNGNDRKRLKQVLNELKIPDGIAVIVRTAGSQRSKAEIRRDYEYLMRLWNEIRDTTLNSTAPELIYEEANLIKRAIRDLYSRDMEEILVEGEPGYKAAKAFMKSLMPSHSKKVQLYKDDNIPLFQRHQVEGQLDAMYSSTVQLRSGGYIVLNPTEALVAIDVNSGRATRERHIESTALKTNLEAAEEIGRQLRLRDLAGLVVIDFIDMEDTRHNREVERKLKEALRHDRARIQLGRISPFGLLEMSRQRLRPSFFESSSEICNRCNGSGYTRTVESFALHLL